MRGKIALLMTVSLIAGLSSFIYQPIWPFLVEEAGIDAPSYGMVAATASLMEFLIRWLFAAFSPPHITLLVASASLAGASGVLLLGPESWTIYSSLSFARVGRALHMMGRNQILSFFREVGMGKLYGLARLGWQLGAIAAPTLGYLLVTSVSREAVLAAGAAMGLITLPLLINVQSDQKPAGRLMFWRGSVSNEAKRIIIATSVNAFARNSFIPFHLVMAPSLFGAGVAHIAAAVMMERSLSALGGAIIGWLSDLLRDRRSVMILSEVLFSSGVLIYAMPGVGLVGFFASTFLIGLGMASFAPIAIATVSEISEERPQDAVGLLSISVSLSRLPAPIVTGLMISLLGYTAAFLLSASVLLAVGLYLALALRGSR